MSEKKKVTIDDLTQCIGCEGWFEETVGRLTKREEIIPAAFTHAGDAAAYFTSKVATKKGKEKSQEYQAVLEYINKANKVVHKQDIIKDLGIKDTTLKNILWHYKKEGILIAWVPVNIKEHLSPQLQEYVHQTLFLVIK